MKPCCLSKTQNFILVQLIYVYEDINGLHELFSYHWDGEFKSLLEGNLPKNLTPNKLTKLLNGKLFSELYNF